MLSEAQKAKRREYYAKNKAVCSARMKAYRKTHFEEIRCKRKESYDKDKNATQCRNWAQRNKERLREYQKKWYAVNKHRLNPEKLKAAQKRHRAKPEVKAKRRVYAAIYLRHRYKVDPNFRMMRILRARLNKILRTKGIAKSTKTFDLIGCTPDFANGYLEGQFTPGMTWANVHIDHHIPCVAFDLTDPGQQKQCFNYSNLKPLLAQDNLKKGRQIPAHY